MVAFGGWEFHHAEIEWNASRVGSFAGGRTEVYWTHSRHWGIAGWQHLGVQRSVNAVNWLFALSIANWGGLHELNTPTLSSLSRSLNEIYHFERNKMKCCSSSEPADKCNAKYRINNEISFAFFIHSNPAGVAVGNTLHIQSSVTCHTVLHFSSISSCIIYLRINEVTVLTPSKSEQLPLSTMFNRCQSCERGARGEGQPLCFSNELYWKSLINLRKSDNRKCLRDFSHGIRLIIKLLGWQTIQFNSLNESHSEKISIVHKRNRLPFIVHSWKKSKIRQDFQHVQPPMKYGRRRWRRRQQRRRRWMMDGRKRRAKPSRNWVNAGILKSNSLIYCRHKLCQSAWISIKISINMAW